jgi:hypothetical protein
MSAATDRTAWAAGARDRAALLEHLDAVGAYALGYGEATAAAARAAAALLRQEAPPL